MLQQDGQQQKNQSNKDKKNFSDIVFELSGTLRLF